MDTRTKHIIAQDRVVIAEQRKLKSEQRKASSYVQLVKTEQRLLEKRFSSQLRSYSSTDLNISRSNSWNENLTLHSNQLSLPQIDAFARRFSACSDGNTGESLGFNSDIEIEGEEDQGFMDHPKYVKRLPAVSVIPPDE